MILNFWLQRGFGTFFPDGIPMNIPLLPDYLRKEGYKSHIFGKWHLGFCSKKYTPTARGFDTFDGLYISVKKYDDLNSTLETDGMTREQLIKHVEMKTIQKLKIFPSFPSISVSSLSFTISSKT